MATIQKTKPFKGCKNISCLSTSVYGRSSVQLESFSEPCSFEAWSFKTRSSAVDSGRRPHLHFHLDREVMEKFYNFSFQLKTSNEFQNIVDFGYSKSLVKRHFKSKRVGKCHNFSSQRRKMLFFKGNVLRCGPRGLRYGYFGQKNRKV